MNESELTDRMTEYSVSLGSCSRRPVSQSPRRSYVWLAAAGTAAVVLGGAVLWPRPASALETLRKIDVAISNATTMRSTWESQLPSGKWRTFLAVAYRDGQWRYDSQKSDRWHVTSINRDGTNWTNYPVLDYWVEQPLTQDDVAPGADTPDALQYVKDSLSVGEKDASDVQVLPHEPVNGAKTYLVHIGNLADSTVADIVVDSATNYPITATSTQTDWVDHGKHRFRFSYDFLASVDDAEFSPDVHQLVVRPQESQYEVARGWQKGLANVKGTQLKDARVTPDGTIWLALTVPNVDSALVLPSSLQAGGQEYARCNDSMLGNYLPDIKAFKSGEPVVVAFVPVDPISPLPKQATVQFAERQLPTQPSQAEKSVGEPVTIALQADSGTVPAYFLTLGLARMTIEAPLQCDTAVAKKLDAEGRYLEAAHAYEKLAETWKFFATYMGHRPLSSAAECYRKLGMTQLASERDMQAKALLDARER